MRKLLFALLLLPLLAKADGITFPNGGGGPTGVCTPATSSSNGCVSPDNLTTFVDGSGTLSAPGAVAYGILTKTANYTLINADWGGGPALTVLCDTLTAAGNITIKLPSDTSAARRKLLIVQNNSTNTCTLDANGNTLTSGATTLTSSIAGTSWILQAPAGVGAAWFVHGCPVGSTTVAGCLKADGTTISVAADGTLSLTHASMTIAGHSIALGGTQTLACSDLTGAATSCSTDATNGANAQAGTFTNAALANMADATIKCRQLGAGSGVPTDCSASQLLTTLGLEHPLFSWGAVPLIYVSSGTMGNNGALSAITALPKIYSGGAYMYFPINMICTVGSGGNAAGWYWVVMSSTTAGTVYNSTYTSGIPTAGTNTAFSCTGPGTMTQTTGAEITAFQYTIPGGSATIGGWWRYRTTFYWNGNANNKIFRLKYGGSNFQSSTVTSNVGVTETITLRKSGAATQDCPASTLGDGSSAGGSTFLGITDSSNQTFAISVQEATATDYFIISSMDAWAF